MDKEVLVSSVIGKYQNQVKRALLNLFRPRRFKFKTIIFTYIVGQMLQIKERREMEEIFRIFDSDYNGTVELTEILAIYRQVEGKEPDESLKKCLYEHFEGLDEYCISFSDFIVHAMDEKILQRSDRLATVFHFFDTDGSGSISPDEIVAGLDFKPSMSEDIAKAMLSEITVGLEELLFTQFTLLMNQFSPQKPQ